jgi:hypothetical protein
MGPILTQLLGNHNHHQRLAELLPKLSKLQLVSDLQTPLNDPRQPHMNNVGPQSRYRLNIPVRRSMNHANSQKWFDPYHHPSRYTITPVMLAKQA